MDLRERFEYLFISRPLHGSKKHWIWWILKIVLAKLVDFMDLRTIFDGFNGFEAILMDFRWIEEDKNVDKFDEFRYFSIFYI